MELTIICRFQRLLASTRLFAHSPFYGFSVPSPLVCVLRVDTLLFALIHAKGMSLRYDADPLVGLIGSIGLIGLIGLIGQPAR